MPTAILPYTAADRAEAIRGYRPLTRDCAAATANIVALAAQMTECPRSHVSLVGTQAEWLLAEHGTDLAERPLNRSFCAHALLTPSETTLVVDATRDARFADNPEVTGPPGIRLYAGAPLVDHDGTALGTLCVMDTRVRSLSQRHLATLTQLADTALATLEMNRSLAEMGQLALLDDLTGLPNRPALMTALGKTIARQARHGERFALAYLDLDGLKQVNDRSGHEAGDRVLRTVAAILARGVRTEDTVARLGGDEFALLLAGNPPNPAAPAERIRTEIESQCAAHGWAITASIGVVSFHALPAGVAVALGLADSIMYRAKRGGRNRLISFTFEGAG